MKNLYPIIYLLICFLIANNANAQKNTVATGGNGTGSGGSVSYSVGQTDYMANTGMGGSVTEGLQQPYEIFIITNITENTNSFSATAYPNPAVESVFVMIDDQDHTDLKYSLTDENGKLIYEEKVSGSQTEIQFKELTSGIYFIRVSDQNTTHKIFKIIKNK